MVVMFLTREADVCEELASRLKDEGYIVSVFSSDKSFFSALEKSPSSVDVLCIDYSFFDHFSFNIFSYLKENSLLIPVVFYNNPHPLREDLSLSWQMQNKSLFPEAMQKTDEKQFALFCTKLYELVTDTTLCEHISLLASPRYFDKEAMKPHHLFSVERFKIKHSLGPVKIRLFQKLFENHDSSVSAESLCRYVWDSYTERNKTTLYAYIHDLRECCHEENDFVMDIVRTGKEMYRLVFAKRESAVLHSIRAREAFERKRYLFEGRKSVEASIEDFGGLELFT